MHSTSDNLRNKTSCKMNAGKAEITMGWRTFWDGAMSLTVFDRYLESRLAPERQHQTTQLILSAPVSQNYATTNCRISMANANYRRV